MRPDALGAEANQDDHHEEDREADDEEERSEDDDRVLAWRISPKAFDAMTAACKRLGITKTTLLNEGIVLALAKRGEKKTADVFTAETAKAVAS